MSRSIRYALALAFAGVGAAMSLAHCAPSTSPVDGGSDVQQDAPSSPTLVLGDGQASTCPATFPSNGDTCTAAATCSYDYPPGYHPSGCSAFCEPVDGGAGFAFRVPGCI